MAPPMAPPIETALQQRVHTHHRHVPVRDPLRGWPLLRTHRVGATPARSAAAPLLAAIETEIIADSFP